jgi:hypothetical protein
MNVSHTFATIYPVQFNSLMHVCACIKGDQCVRVALITEEQSGDASNTERYNKRITTPVGWLSPPATTRRPDLFRIGITWTSSLRNERG